MHQAPVTTVKLKFCVVNCYPKASRKNFDLSDFGHPHDTAVRFRGITRHQQDISSFLNKKKKGPVPKYLEMIRL